MKSGIATESAYYMGDSSKISLEVAEASQLGSAEDEKTRKRPNEWNCQGHLTVNPLSFRLITIYYFSMFSIIGSLVVYLSLLFAANFLFVGEIIMILNNKGTVDVSFLIDQFSLLFMNL